MKNSNEHEGCPEHILQLRQSVNDYVHRYLEYRDPKNLIGEFLDKEGCQHQQYGFGGIGFVLGLKRKHALKGNALISAEELLKDGISKSEEKRSTEQKKVLKDLFKIPTKSILFCLFSDDKRHVNSILKDIFNNCIANGLIKPSANHPSDEGDAVVTCHVLQLIHFSGITISKAIQTKIAEVISSLKNELREKNHEIYISLFLSTTICLYDYKNHIKKHRSLLRNLYKIDKDWTSVFSSSNSFLEVWYPDGSEGRYLKIPKSYVILSSIYVIFGDQERYFRFGPVRKIFDEIKTSYEEYAKNNRTKSTAYSIFFLYASLYPEKYFKLKKSSWLSYFVTSIVYLLDTLTLYGWLVVLAIVFGGLRAFFLTFDLIFTNQLANFTFATFSDLFAPVVIVITGLLCLTKTRKR